MKCGSSFSLTIKEQRTVGEQKEARVWSLDPAALELESEKRKNDRGRKQS
jgi:hypothetical protein